MLRKAGDLVTAIPFESYVTYLPFLSGITRLILFTSLVVSLTILIKLILLICSLVYSGSSALDLMFELSIYLLDLPSAGDSEFSFFSVFALAGRDLLTLALLSLGRLLGRSLRKHKVILGLLDILFVVLAITLSLFITTLSTIYTLSTLSTFVVFV